MGCDANHITVHTTTRMIQKSTYPIIKLMFQKNVIQAIVIIILMLMISTLMKFKQDTVPILATKAMHDMNTTQGDQHNGHLNSLQLCTAIYLNVDERKYILRGNKGNCINILTQLQSYGKECDSSPANKQTTGPEGTQVLIVLFDRFR